MCIWPVYISTQTHISSAHFHSGSMAALLDSPAIVFSLHGAGYRGVAQMSPDAWLETLSCQYFFHPGVRSFLSSRFSLSKALLCFLSNFDSGVCEAGRKSDSAISQVRSTPSMWIFFSLGVWLLQAGPKCLMASSFSQALPSQDSALPLKEWPRRREQTLMGSWKSVQSVQR